ATMNKRRRSRSVKAEPRPRATFSGAWRWGIILFGVFVLAALALSALRSKPIPQDGSPAPSSFLPTVENTTPATEPAPEGMVWIPGGEFSMGSDDSGEALCGLAGV